MVVKGIKCGTKKKEREEGGEKTEIKIESSMRRMRMRERERVEVGFVRGRKRR